MRVGFITVWYERGGSYLCLMAREALEAAGHTTFILTRHLTPKAVGAEWDVPRLTRVGGRLDRYHTPAWWVKENKLDVLIAVGKAGWDGLQTIRRSGCVTARLLMWEFSSREDAEESNARFDAVLASTLHDYARYRALGYYNVRRLQWGVDTELFRPEVGDGPTRFIHPAGYGGVGDRRATDAVLSAFKPVNGATLEVLTQRGKGTTQRGAVTTRRGTLPRDEFARVYRSADVAPLPSRWEGLGLPFMEALASGLAVVTVDAPPMTDYVVDGENGFLCEGHLSPPFEKLHIPQAVVDGEALARRIELLARDPDAARQMGQASRRLALARFAWDEGKRRALVRTIEEL